MNLFDSLCALGLDPMVDSHPGSPDLAFGHLAAGDVEAHGMLQCLICTGLPEEKYNKEYGGPGIRTQVLMVFAMLASPLGHYASFVNIIRIIYNKTKQFLWIRNKQKRANYLNQPLGR